MMHFDYKAHRFYRQFAIHLKTLLGRRLPRTLVVACSGGADSVALVDLMHRFACEHAVIPVIVHVNHQLRGRESMRDARFVKALCTARQLPHVILQAPVSKAGNVQHEARHLRYAALAAAARHTRSPVVLTAHHANDQAETVLLHLLRGSGPEALAGIPVRRKLVRGVALLRPLLGVGRDDLRQYIRSARLRYVVDRSNRSLKYTRNWIRAKVLPVLEEHNPKIVEALGRVAASCRKDHA
jgi:tRNA(Ile)-lysidine synthase